MLRALLLAVVQSALLAGGQVFLKLALARMPRFAMSRHFWVSMLCNWQFACCGLLFGASSVLWMYIVRRYPLSVAYPMISLSYVFGMLAAVAFFGEQVSVWKWAGVALIVAGCCLVAK